MRPSCARAAVSARVALVCAWAATARSTRSRAPSPEPDGPRPSSPPVPATGLPASSASSRDPGARRLGSRSGAGARDRRRDDGRAPLLVNLCGIGLDAARRGTLQRARARRAGTLAGYLTIGAREILRLPRAEYAHPAPAAEEWTELRAADRAARTRRQYGAVPSWPPTARLTTGSSMSSRWRARPPLAWPLRRRAASLPGHA